MPQLQSRGINGIAANNKGETMMKQTNGIKEPVLLQIVTAVGS
jgi:hypothetical protein